MRNKILDEFVINFINNHFNEIDLKRVEWKVKTKEQAINEINKNADMASWIITEVMSWGTPINYIEEFKVENDEDHFIIKVNDKYFAIDYNDTRYFIEVFPTKVEKLVFNNLPINKSK